MGNIIGMLTEKLYIKVDQWSFLSLVERFDFSEIYVHCVLSASLVHSCFKDNSTKTYSTYVKKTDVDFIEIETLFWEKTLNKIGLTFLPL